MLRKSLEEFVVPNYGKTKRSQEVYKTVFNRCLKNITRLIEEYWSVENDQQLLREIRDEVDYNLRRYHKYCIKEKDGVGAHYFDISAKETDFEHLIPASRIRDLLLYKIITPSQALNAPTVSLCKDKHKKLADSGWGEKSPNMWLPFKRYSQVFSGEYQTFDGKIIDPNTWTLEDHFKYFNGFNN